MVASATPGASVDPALHGAASLDVAVTGFRSDRGVVRVMLCPAGTPFPDCGAHGLGASAVIADRTAHVRFADLAPGRYAVSVFHDENRSGHIQTVLGIPTSGFGFSANPPLRPRPPRFGECAIAVNDHATTAIALRYLF